MKTKRTFRKTLLTTVVAVSAFVLIRFCIKLFVGNIDYGATLLYEHTRVDDDRVKTEFPDMSFVAGNSWYRIPLKPDCMGGAGFLISVNGILNYEYGPFTPASHQIDGYTIDHDTINSRPVMLLESRDEFGIYFPLTSKDSLTIYRPFIIYPSVRAKTMKGELLKIAGTLTYNFD